MDGNGLDRIGYDRAYLQDMMQDIGYNSCVNFHIATLYMLKP